MRRKFFLWLVSKQSTHEGRMMIALWDGIFDLGLYRPGVVEFKRETSLILRAVKEGLKHGRR